MTKICKYCNIEYSSDSGNVFSSHVRWCIKNPNRDIYTKKATKANLSYIDRTYGRVQSYIKKCKKCDVEYEVICRESQLNNSHRVKQYCSRKCANSRTHSTETKTKIANKLSGTYRGNIVEPIVNIHCNECGINFSPSRKNAQYCSRVCSGRVNIKKASLVYLAMVKDNPEKYSIIQKNAYRNGTQRVGGGITKWIQYKNIKVQGTYEYRTCIVLDKMVDTGAIKSWDYTSDRYSYVDVNGKIRNYLIDFKIVNNDDTFYYIEVKGYLRENDELKWEAVRNMGYRLDVWFNKDIIRYENEFNIHKS